MTTKKRLLKLAAALTGLSAGPALAQTHDWSGFYLGAQAGASRDRVDASATLQIDQESNLAATGIGLIVVPGTAHDYTASGRSTGATGGGFVGYQRQFEHILLGIEGDFAPLGDTVSATQTFLLPATALRPPSTIAVRRDMRFDDRWSARLRLGYSTGETLFYATGGYARTRARMTSIDSYTNPGGPAAPELCFGNQPCRVSFGPEGPVVTTASASRWLSGWTAGAGIEHKLGRSLSIGLEYRHTHLNGKTFTPTNAVTVNTGPTTRGDNVFGDGFGVTGSLGSVEAGPTRINTGSDTLSVRLAIHF
jgi:outer membrane immunogenic protein